MFNHVEGVWVHHNDMIPNKNKNYASPTIRKTDKFNCKSYEQIFLKQQKQYHLSCVLYVALQLY